MNFNEVGLSLGHLLNLLELTSAIPGNFDQNMFTENGFSTFLPKKRPDTFLNQNIGGLGLKGLLYKR